MEAVWAVTPVAVLVSPEADAVAVLVSPEAEALAEPQVLEAGLAVLKPHREP
jgi:hypothetical protein